MEAVTALVVLTIAYCYVLALLSRRASAVPGGSGDEAPFFVLLVPMLNEESVIGDTLKSLLALRGRFLVLVVDDASHDRTVEVIRPFLADPRVRLLERPLNEARTGKGAVLNAGYAEIQRLRLAERYGTMKVVVVVFDADGRVDPNFLQAVAPYFRDPRTAGVQSAVRMYNADHNVLTFWQNFEFVVWGELFARGKDRLGSATLGGNGQCVRLNALMDLGEQPWQASLTEDLNLSLQLLTRGWRLRFCPSTAVWQEALPTPRALVRQRSRWLQGHLAAWGMLPALLCGPLPVRTKADLVIFLVLPITLLPVGFATVVSWALFLLDLGHWDLVGMLAGYALGFGVTPLVAAAWTRAETGGAARDWARAVLRAHAFLFYSFVWFLASLVASWNVLLGRRAWAKTSRVGEPAHLMIDQKAA